MASASKFKYENINNFLLLVNAMVRVLTEVLKMIDVAKHQSLKGASEFFFFFLSIYFVFFFSIKNIQKIKLQILQTFQYNKRI